MLAQARITILAFVDNNPLWPHHNGVLETTLSYAASLPLNTSVLLTIIALVGLYGFFVVAVACLGRYRLRGTGSTAEAATAGFHGRAGLIHRRLEFYLLSCQVGMFMTALMGSWFVLDILWSQAWPREFADWFAKEISRGGLVTWQGVIAGILCSFIVTLCALTLSRILKSLALGRFDSVMRYLALPIIGASWILFPFTFIILHLSGFLCRILHVPLAREGDFAASAEEISELVEQSGEAGKIEPDELEMIQGVFSYSNTTAQEVMTPRKDVISVSERAALKEILDVFAKQGLSRLLVTGAQMDQVRGVIMAKDVLSFVAGGAGDFQIARFLRPAYFVPGSKKISDLMQELRARATHLAVVLDEHGGVDGLVTMEDIIEEIVGEIFDEFDIPEQELEAIQLDSGDLLVDGRMLIEDLNRQFHLALPFGEYKTIAGLVFHRLGRIPNKGEVLDLSEGKIKVADMERTRITRLVITPLTAKRALETAVEDRVSKPNAQIPESKISRSDSNLWGQNKQSTPGKTIPGKAISAEGLAIPEIGYSNSK